MGSGFINKELPAACHHVPGMSDPHIVVTLSQWVEAARRWGAKAEIELVPVASYFGTHEVESSVGIPMDIDINILTHEEIKQFIQDYAVSARNAMKAGADIVNVHGAHGQLPALLFNPVSTRELMNTALRASRTAAALQLSFLMQSVLNAATILLLSTVSAQPILLKALPRLRK